MENMTVAIDAMGGDAAPGVVIRGAVDYLKDNNEEGKNRRKKKQKALPREFFTNENSRDKREQKGYYGANPDIS